MRNTGSVRVRALLLVSAGLVMLVVIGFVAVLGESHETRLGVGGDDGVLITDVGALRQGDVMPIKTTLPGARHKAIRVFVVHPYGQDIEALLGISTHLGCTLKWVEDPHYERFTTARGVTFEDPCGGSVFGLDGSWCGGPAPRAMDRFASTVVDGELAIDLNDIVLSPRRQITSTDECATKRASR
jgi:Rieske Fe-S protein